MAKMANQRKVTAETFEINEAESSTAAAAAAAGAWRWRPYAKAAAAKLIKREMAAEIA